MSTRNLDKLMAPKSVVAIGASARPGSVGAAVTRNLLGGRTSRARSIWSTARAARSPAARYWRSLVELPAPPDLAVDHDAARRPCPALLQRAGRAGHQGRRHHQRRPRRGRRRRARTTRAGARSCCGSPSRTCCASSGRTASATWRRSIGLNASFGPAKLKAGPAGGDRAVGRGAGGARRLGQRAGHRLLAPRSRWATWPTSISATCSTSWRATTRRARS